MSDAATTTGNTLDAPTTAPQSAAPMPTAPAIDIERLTEKVYRLMLADLRQEQMRRGGKR